MPFPPDEFHHPQSGESTDLRDLATNYVCGVHRPQNMHSHYEPGGFPASGLLQLSRHPPNETHNSIMGNMAIGLLELASPISHLAFRIRQLAFNNSHLASRMILAACHKLLCVGINRFYMTAPCAQWASCQIRKIAGAHAPGMPGTFSPSPQVNDPDMHHGTCVTHVP